MEDLAFLSKFIVIGGKSNSVSLTGNEPIMVHRFKLFLFHNASKLENRTY